jgi:hypothetical protein
MIGFPVLSLPQLADIGKACYLIAKELAYGNRSEGDLVPEQA